MLFITFGRGKSAGFRKRTLDLQKELRLNKIINIHVNKLVKEFSSSTEAVESTMRIGKAREAIKKLEAKKPMLKKALLVWAASRKEAYVGLCRNRLQYFQQALNFFEEKKKKGYGVYPSVIKFFRETVLCESEILQVLLGSSLP